MPEPGKFAGGVREPRQPLGLIRQSGSTASEGSSEPSGPRWTSSPWTELISMSSTTRSLAVAVVRAPGRWPAAAARCGRCAGSPGGSRGPSPRCSAPRRRRTARCRAERGKDLRWNPSLPSRSGETSRMSHASSRGLLRSSGHSSRVGAVERERRTPSRSAIRIWSRISESSGLIRTVGPAPVAQQLRGEEVDDALPPTGRLDDEHPLAPVDERLDGLELTRSKAHRTRAQCSATPGPVSRGGAALFTGSAQPCSPRTRSDRFGASPSSGSLLGTCASGSQLHPHGLRQRTR